MLKNEFKFESNDGKICTAVKTSEKHYSVTWMERWIVYMQSYSREVVENLISIGTWKIIDDEIKVSTIHKDRDFNDLTGRYFKVFFRHMYEFENRFSLRDSKLEYIEGYLEDFMPMETAIFNDKKYGFNIIPYQLIVQMIEVKSNKQ